MSSGRFQKYLLMNLKVVGGHQSDLLKIIDRNKNKRTRTLVNMISSNPRQMNFFCFVLFGKANDAELNSNISI